MSADGKLFATAGDDGAVRIYDAASLKEQHQLKGHGAPVTALAFAPDGKTLASGGQDYTARLWDVDSGREVRRFTGHGKGVVCLAYSPDGRLLACGSGDNFIRVFDPADEGTPPVRLGPHPGGPLALSFSGDGRTLASCGRDRNVRLWEVATRRERRQLKGHSHPVDAVAFAPRDNLIASGGRDGSLRLWEADTGRELRRAPGHMGAIHAICFAADCKSMFSAGADTTILVWDVATLIHDPLPPVADLSSRQLETLWSDLASEEDETAYEAVHTLSAAGKQGVTLIRQRVRPVAAELIARWLAQLDDDRFTAREKATEELAELGKLVEGPLRKHLQGDPSVESRRRMEALLHKIEETTFSPERARAIRAVEVLERIGSAEAKRVLETLATGAPDAELTREASAALKRLANRRRPAP
jgi:WD40 repeat protein